MQKLQGFVEQGNTTLSIAGAAGTITRKVQGSFPSATVTVYINNPSAVAISSISRTANVVTVTIPASSGFIAGESVTIAGVTDASFNGTFTIVTSGATTFTYAQTAANASSSAGTASSTLRLATIYSDDASTPTSKSNPFVSSSNATWFFYTSNGRYDLNFSGAGISVPFTLSDISVGLGGSGVPSYALASLPASKAQNAGNLARVRDDVGGLWVDSGTQWVKSQPYVNVREAPFNAVGGGSIDDSAAFQAAINTGRRVLVPYISGGYKITTPLVAVSGMALIGEGNTRPNLIASVAGKHIIGGSSLSNVTIDGLSFTGVNSSTVPTDSVGGFAAAETGLVTINTSTDVRITNCECGTFYNGITSEQSTRVWITNNYVHNWLFVGILASKSVRFSIDYNNIIGCDQTGAVGAYGVQATGDQAGGHTESSGSISFNNIADIPSWDGMMAHDVDGLAIIGNDIRNVRTGIDIGFLASTNIIKNLRISGNYIKSTTTNTWGATPAAMGGIAVSGYDNTNLLIGATIVNNVIDGFFSTAGMVGAGNVSNIVVSYTSGVTVSGNSVVNAGSAVSNAGVFVVGRNNGISITGNALQGSMSGGGVRLFNVLSDTATIVGNTIRQTTTSDVGVLINGTTAISVGFVYGPNASNSTAGNEFQIAGTVTFIEAGPFRYGSVVYNPPNLPALTNDSVNVTVPGAVLGDLVSAISFSLDPQNVIFFGAVTAADRVTVTLFNSNPGGPVDLAQGTIRVRVTLHNQ